VNDPAPDPDSDAFDEVREAAGAVIAALKQFVEASERVVEDPAAFSTLVDRGRSIIEAFTGGFAAQASPSEADAADPTAQGGDSSPES
jgi:hypothetical protein